MRRAADGIDALAPSHDFNGAKDLNHTRQQCRELLDHEAKTSALNVRARVDLHAALMSDAALKKDKRQDVIEPTPLCLLSGQGHQHFLERLASAVQKVTPLGGKGKTRIEIPEWQCLTDTLFSPWRRCDPKDSSFRWDPEEDVRYALMAGDPTDSAYKTGTQYGANRLAALGLAALTLVPRARLGHVSPTIVGGVYDREGFSFAWPVWRDPATLAAVRALLAHPSLRTTGGLNHLGVDHVLVARRIRVERFMNVSRARPLS
jgi:hypothetical protein